MNIARTFIRYGDILSTKHEYISMPRRAGIFPVTPYIYNARERPFIIRPSLRHTPRRYVIRPRRFAPPPLS